MQIDKNKLDNKSLIESLFKDIEEKLKFHIVNKYYTDTYFIIEDEENSICEFNIKEIPRIQIWYMEYLQI